MVEVNNKSGTTITGLTVTTMTNVINVMSPIMKIKVNRDYRAKYKYGLVMIILKDAGDNLLPDDTIFELRFSDREATFVRLRDVKLTADISLMKFNRLDQKDARNLQSLTPLYVAETEVTLNEGEYIEFCINSSVAVSHTFSEIILFNWEVEKVK